MESGVHAVRISGWVLLLGLPCPAELHGAVEDLGKGVSQGLVAVLRSRRSMAVCRVRRLVAARRRAGGRALRRRSERDPDRHAGRPGESRLAGASRTPRLPVRATQVLNAYMI